MNQSLVSVKSKMLYSPQGNLSSIFERTQNCKRNSKPFLKSAAPPHRRFLLDTRLCGTYLLGSVSVYRAPCLRLLILTATQIASARSEKTRAARTALETTSGASTVSHQAALGLLPITSLARLRGRCLYRLHA